MLASFFGSSEPRARRICTVAETSSSRRKAWLRMPASGRSKRRVSSWYAWLGQPVGAPHPPCVRPVALRAEAPARDGPLARQGDARVQGLDLREGRRNGRAGRAATPGGDARRGRAGLRVVQARNLSL